MKRFRVHPNPNHAGYDEIPSAEFFAALGTHEDRVLSRCPPFTWLKDWRPIMGKEFDRIKVDRAFFTTNTYLRQQARAKWDGAEPRMHHFAETLLNMARKRGIPLFVHCAMRSDAEQQRLLDEGYTKAGPGQSPHQWGCAVDIIHSRYAWHMSKDEWGLIGRIGKEAAKLFDFKVEWGGDWRFYDPAHWQLADWKEVREDRLREG